MISRCGQHQGQSIEIEIDFSVVWELKQNARVLADLAIKKDEMNYWRKQHKWKGADKHYNRWLTASSDKKGREHQAAAARPGRPVTTQEGETNNVLRREMDGGGLWGGEEADVRGGANT